MNFKWAHLRLQELSITKFIPPVGLQSTGVFDPTCAAFYLWLVSLRVLKTGVLSARKVNHQ